MSAELTPATAQRWNLMTGFKEAASSPSAQSEIRGWTGLAILSLGIAGIFALLLAFSRLPGIQDIFPWPLEFFEKGLIIHVIFSFSVWFLSIFGALTALATLRVSAGKPKLSIFGPIALWGSYLSCILLFVPALMDRGEPSLNNYIPIIIDPLYYAGLGILGASLALTTIRLIANLPRREGPLEPVSLGILVSGVLYLAALGCIAFAWAHLRHDLTSFKDLTLAFNEDLVWGGGHVLQFSNIAMLMVAWYLLGGISLSKPLINPRYFHSISIMTFCITFFPISAYFLTDMFTGEQRQIFTDMQYLMAIPTVLFSILALKTLFIAKGDQSTPLPWKDPGFLCLILSALVFGTGGVLGLFVDGTDTRTPAHYHGMIGGINLAFMGLYFSFFLPLLGREPVPGRRINWLIHLYAWGQILASIGLFLAGGYGAPRKTAGAEQGIVEYGAKIGLYINGIGALIAVIGGVMFIWITAKVLLRRA